MVGQAGVYDACVKGTAVAAILSMAELRRNLVDVITSGSEYHLLAVDVPKYASKECQEFV